MKCMAAQDVCACTINVDRQVKLQLVHSGSIFANSLLKAGAKDDF